MAVNVNIMPKMIQAQNVLRGPLVAVLVYDGLCTFEFGVAYEIFGLDRPEMGDGWYRYRLAAMEPGRLRAAGGLFVEADGDLAVLDEADLIIVPGWRDRDAPVPFDVCEALRRSHARGCRIASLCSGVFVLAASGILDGRRATTHWRYASDLAARYPAISIEPDVLYVDNGTLLTAAGSAAAIDLCLHIVRKDFGADAANRVARRLVVPSHRDGGQAQFIERPVAAVLESERLGALLDWMREHVADDQPLVRLAERAGMSLRTFQRRFEEMTGVAPGQWLIIERVQRAREVLEQEPELGIEQVAQLSGFGAAATLRHHFRRVIGTSPTDYRQKFALRA
jgi:AraC family transcriptional regulator, transcriptional activator FtrA